MIYLTIYRKVFHIHLHNIKQRRRRRLQKKIFQGKNHAQLHVLGINNKNKMKMLTSLKAPMRGNTLVSDLM